MLIKLLVGHDVIHTSNSYTTVVDEKSIDCLHTGDQWYIANHIVEIEPTDDLQLVDVVKGTTTTYYHNGGWRINGHKLFTKDGK